MYNSTLESIIGLIVLTVAVIFLIFSWDIIGTSYTGKIVKVEFGDIGSLKVGDDVKISGIKVGEVIKSELDFETFNAIVYIDLEESINLSQDSLVKISNTSLLGGNYIEIIPGADDEIITKDGVLYNSIDPVSLTDLVGKAIFSSPEK